MTRTARHSASRRTEVRVVRYLATVGELTPGELGTRLQISSGGTAALIQRLEKGGHVSCRRRRDRPSAMVTLTPDIPSGAADAWALLVDDTDSCVSCRTQRGTERVEAPRDRTCPRGRRHARAR